MTAKSTVVTRFAPSPTGYLHIGGARTALFNWLFARRAAREGADARFLLRIEDTDRARSTEDAVDKIYDGLRWLGLDWDGEPVRQFERADRHAAVAQDLLARGLAYRCYATPDELAAMREEARAAGRPPRYDGRWRDKGPADWPANAPYAVRLKAPQSGETRIDDAVQGSVSWSNEQLDDLILLRSDGTPTYMLAVVVDDHDMSVTHVVRGDDHLTNAARQTLIYAACGWTPPIFGHIPLIHGPDGAKLSKRHGALGVEAYRDMGYLPDAMRNYLVRLGWSHGDDEVFSTDQAIAWFDLEHIGRSPARFDFQKLEALNGVYLRNRDDAALFDEVMAALARQNRAISAAATARLRQSIAGLKERAKTLNELITLAEFALNDGVVAPDAAAQRHLDADGRARLQEAAAALGALERWDDASVEAAIRGVADAAGVKLGKVAQPLRAALTGRTVSPGIFEVAAALGRELCLQRLKAASSA